VTSQKVIFFELATVLKFSLRKERQLYLSGIVVSVHPVMKVEKVNIWIEYYRIIVFLQVVFLCFKDFRMTFL
jgi:hypothetical protein